MTPNNTIIGAKIFPLLKYSKLNHKIMIAPLSMKNNMAEMK